MKTWRETSSVKMTSEPAFWLDVCVTDGLSLERRKRAWLPFWSHSMYLRAQARAEWEGAARAEQVTGVSVRCGRERAAARASPGVTRTRATTGRMAAGAHMGVGKRERMISAASSFGASSSSRKFSWPGCGRGS